MRTFALAFLAVLSLLTVAWPAPAAAQAEANAICANAAGDGAIIQAAVSTGRTVHIVGPCLGDSMVSLSTPGQIIHGDGRDRTLINVHSVVGATFLCATGEPGPVFRDFGIVFTQINTQSRSSLTPYNPAFSCQNTPRFEIQHVAIKNAMIGIDMRGNSGGAIVDDLEESALTAGIWIDGSEDSISINNWHFYPFNIQQNSGNCGSGTPSGECAIYLSTNAGCAPQTTSGTAGAIALVAGRADDLKISNSLFLVGTSICFVPGSFSAEGAATAEITNTAFDSYGGINMQAPATAQPQGQVSISSSYFSLATNGYQSINLLGGLVQCNACRFYQPNGGGLAVVGGTSGQLAISNSYFDLENADTYAVQFNTAGSVTLNNVQLHVMSMPITNRTKPAFCIGCNAPGPIAVISGVQPLDPIGSGTLISIGADNYHRIVGNSLNVGWTNQCPTGAVHAVFANNGTGAAASCN